MVGLPTGALAPCRLPHTGASTLIEATGAFTHLLLLPNSVAFLLPAATGAFVPCLLPNTGMLILPLAFGALRIIVRGAGDIFFGFCIPLPPAIVHAK